MWFYSILTIVFLVREDSFDLEPIVAHIPETNVVRWCLRWTRAHGARSEEEWIQWKPPLNDPEPQVCSVPPVQAAC